MQKEAGVDLGDQVKVALDYDDEPRRELAPKSLTRALQASTRAKQAWKNLAPSRRKEILRYLNNLKGPGARERVVQRVLRQLTETKHEDPRNGRRHRP